jgi:NAD+ synthase (glutamine-hydrolysing)
MMRLALGQINTTVGDLAGNIEKMHAFWQRARQAGVDLLIFPECAVCGYPPEDLLHKRHFLEDNRRAVEILAQSCPEGRLIAGFAEGKQGRVYNAAAFIENGRVTGSYHKGRLPNFSVFDESRYFEPGSTPAAIPLGPWNATMTICYDLWNQAWLQKWLAPVTPLHLIFNISASPFDVGKLHRREDAIRHVATTLNCPVFYTNLVGGQDELVFDGRSMVLDAAGRVVARARAFAEDLLLVDVEADARGSLRCTAVEAPAPTQDHTLEEVYQALVLGTRDYIRKNGFRRVLLGVSGGIDSALTAAIAVAAVGPENVTTLTMPSRFNSPETIADARKLAENLNVELRTVPIGDILYSFHRELSTSPDWDDQGLAYENLQARIRGTLLMSLSNQLGALVLTTGNKSETSVGYSTLYGDTAGGFAVIKDVPKTLVYRLSEYINQRAGRELIPQDTLTREPSAELRPDQKDSDSLPDYDILDRILRGYIELDQSAAQLIAAGLPAADVHRVVRLVDRNEYKRRQSPPGIRITTKAFGKDRRLPITNHYNPLDTGLHAVTREGEGTP